MRPSLSWYEEEMRGETRQRENKWFPQGHAAGQSNPNSVVPSVICTLTLTHRNRSWRRMEKNNETSAQMVTQEMKAGFWPAPTDFCWRSGGVVRASAIGWGSGWICGQRGSQTAVGLRRIFLSQWLVNISFLSYNARCPGRFVLCGTLKVKKHRCDTSTAISPW